MSDKNECCQCGGCGCSHCNAEPQASSARPAGCAEDEQQGVGLSVDGETVLFTVGELRRLLEPFTDDCPMSGMVVMYVPAGGNSARLAVKVLHND